MRSNAVTISLAIPNAAREWVNERKCAKCPAGIFQGSHSHLGADFQEGCYARINLKMWSRFSKGFTGTEPFDERPLICAVQVLVEVEREFQMAPQKGLRLSRTLHSGEAEYIFRERPPSMPEATSGGLQGEGTSAGWETRSPFSHTAASSAGIGQSCQRR